MNSRWPQEPDYPYSTSDAGLLRLLGLITEAELQTMDRFTRLARDYAFVTEAPHGHPGASLAEKQRSCHDPVIDNARAVRIEKQYKAMQSALRGTDVKQLLDGNSTLVRQLLAMNLPKRIQVIKRSLELAMERVHDAS